MFECVSRDFQCLSTYFNYTSRTKPKMMNNGKEQVDCW
jgi:hypothetical protein